MSLTRKPGVHFVREAAAKTTSTPPDTRTIFMVGPTQKGKDNTPVKVTSGAQFIQTFGMGASKLRVFGEAVINLLDLPVRDVWVVKAADSGGQGKPSKAELAAALASITVDLGPGTVLIPGATEKDALDVLGAHCATMNRVAFVDVPDADPSSDALKQAATTARNVEKHADRLCLVGPWLTDGHGGKLPASVFAAAQTAQSDAMDNVQPIGQQVPQHHGRWQAHRFSDADATAIYEAGCNLVVTGPAGTYLSGYRSLSLANWADFASVRLFMAVETQCRTLGAQFVGKPITAQTVANWHGALTGLLAQVFTRGGLYGAADEAYSVDTAGVNTPETAANRELLATIRMRVAEHVEVVKVTGVGVPVTEEI